MGKTYVNARDRYEKAARELMRATAADYPIGSVVSVTIGNATFDAEITRHASHWWSTPDQLEGRNLKTGKTRTFIPFQVNEVSWSK